jgi:hypothetical protein
MQVMQQVSKYTPRGPQLVSELLDSCNKLVSLQMQIASPNTPYYVALLTISY